jgi:hypothetical protein
MNVTSKAVFKHFDPKIVAFFVCSLAVKITGLLHSKFVIKRYLGRRILFEISMPCSA